MSATGINCGDTCRQAWSREATAGLVMCATVLAACQSPPATDPPPARESISTPPPSPAEPPPTVEQPAPPAITVEPGSAERPAATAAEPAAAKTVTQAAPPPSKPATVVDSAPPARLRDSRPSPGQNQYYDRGNPSYDLLQKANTALARFPIDDEGQIDWVRALRSGKINPRVSVSGSGEMRSDSREIVMRNTREMPFVMFPHSVHTEWLDCSNCHEQIFVAKKGANAINMDAIFRGRYCGVCHDKVAFSTYVCDRCHSVPNPDSQP